jgi:hypothetical protein
MEVNDIFTLELFVQVFNTLYDEKLDLKLESSALVDPRVYNWNKINGNSISNSLATICFNYLQQKFYLMSPTMKTLAKGNNETAILRVLHLLINSV